MSEQTEADALAAIITANRAPFSPDKGGNFLIVPGGYRLEDLERFQERPNRITAAHTFVAVDSLEAYLARFATAETMVTVDYTRQSIAAVIDGDAPDAPSHRAHKASFEARKAHPFSDWLAICGKGMSQTDFALFLEDRALDLAEPDAATVMEMVLKFEATKKVEFKSSTRLHDGSRQFVFVEDTQQKGALTLPDHFIVLTPIFEGMEPERVKFMVRYRIDEGKLRFTVQLHDADMVLRRAFERCVDALRTGLSLDLPFYVTG